MDVCLLRQYAAEGLTRRAIAEKLGMSYSRTTTVLREKGISVPRKKHERKKSGPRPQTLKILELRKQGLTHKEIANRLNCTKETSRDACVKYGLKVQGPPTTEAQAIDVISKAGYDYVSGFVNAHSKVTVRCRVCGGLLEHMYRCLREKASGTYKYEMQCPHCEQRKWEEYRRKKREPKEREAQERAQRRAEQLSRKASEQLVKRLAIHVCKNCGQRFCIASTGYNSEQYCSKKCQQRWHDRVKNEKRMDRLIARDHDTDITLERLFKRDGGVCYICGKSCDWSDIVERDGTMIAGENYPSIDHVKPVSKGGTHTWSNVRLACRACNTLKGWK